MSETSSPFPVMESEIDTLIILARMRSEMKHAPRGRPRDFSSPGQFTLTRVSEASLRLELI